MRQICTLSLLLLLVPVAPAEDWPQWLGPTRQGVSAQKVAPWTAPLPILWKQKVGEGHSSVVVAEGKVFLHTKNPTKNEELVSAYDGDKGTVLWQQPVERGAFKGLFGDGPRATPTVAGGKIYTLGITGILTALDTQTGKEVWKINTVKDFEATIPFFGVSMSPLVEANKVFVNVGGKGASIVAFDTHTGKTLWQKLDDKASYASPIAIGPEDKKLVVFLTSQQLVALSAKDGATAWQFPLVDKLFESSTTPVRVGDRIFASSVTFGGSLIKPTAGKAEQVWFKSNLNCYFSTPVVVDDKYLYVVTGSGIVASKKEAVLHCVDIETGNDLWPTTKKVGTYHASLTRTADDKLLLLEEGGDLILLDPNPKEYRELARTHICGHTWSHAAISNGRLYVRDEKELVCVGLGK